MCFIIVVAEQAVPLERNISVKTAQLEGFWLGGSISLKALYLLEGKEREGGSKQ